MRAAVVLLVGLLGPLGPHWGAQALTRDDFYTNGRGLDHQVPQGDETSSGEVRLTKPISFFDEKYDSIFVNTNGVLSFSTDITTFINNEFPLGLPVIAPFYSNVDTSRAGTVYYRETQDAYTLAKASEDIRTCFPNHYWFQPESVFIATWSDVGYYNKKDDKTNTFQAVVISGGNDSYVAFLYPEDGIQWIQANPQVIGLSDARAQVGMTAHEGQAFVNKVSGKERVRNIASSTNCGQPGKYMYRVGETQYKIEEPEMQQYNELENQSSLTCASAGQQQCHLKARCTDYARGFCCVCGPDYYGNGKACIRRDVPLRVHGKVTAEINGEHVDNLDFQSYIVMADGRTYSALSGVSDRIGYSMQTLNVLGGVVGWLFAKPVGNTKNGYELTGGSFNHTTEILFPETNQKITIRQTYSGLDVYDQLRMEADIRGSLPKIPPGSKLETGDYTEQYSFSQPGEVLSQSTRIFRNRGLLGEYRCIITQTFNFQVCQYAPRNELYMEPVNLKVSKNFLGYEPRDRIIRYGMSNKLLPLNQEDPCIKGRETCGPKSSCVVEDDSFKCICNAGYQQMFTNTGETLCLDINECATDEHNCHFDARCLNREGTFECQCNPGYQGNGIECTQASPCEMIRCGPNSECVEMQGHAHCRCLEGFTNEESGCVPDNQRRNPCDYYECGLNSRCVLSNGQPECRCHSGFSRQGNDCVENRPYQGCDLLENCSPYAQCVRNSADGTYYCVCDYDYIGDGYTCEPRNEGSSGPNSAETESPYEPDDQEDEVLNATCAFNECWCPSHYQLNGNYCFKVPPEDLTTPPPATEDNGSQMNCNVLATCHPYAQCVYDGTLNDYKCECTAGYEGDGRDCVETEENCENADICDRYAVCRFDPATSKSICVCEPGYVGNGFVCLMNECESSNNCEENAECKSTETSQSISVKKCVCDPGYVKDSNNACIPDGNCNGVICAEHASCHWDPQFSIHYCQCDEGFSGDGIEKCSLRTTQCNYLQDCDENADCIADEIDGQFRCICRRGYIGDGHLCTKVVTCEDNPYLCSSHATCIERLEGYVCECNSGYIGNGTICKTLFRNEGNVLLLNQGMSTLRIPLKPTLLDPARPIQYGYYQMAVGLDVDCQEERVYWSDITGKMIKSSNYDGTIAETVFTQDINSPEGLSIDWVSRNIFWTDSRKDTIEVASLTTHIRHVLFDTDLVDPRGIAVHPFKGKIFWSDWNRKNPKIEWANMDGTGREVFLSNKYVTLPNSLAIDFDTDELCYADAGKKTIECVHIDTMKNRTVADQCSYPFGLAVTPTHYFWTDWITQKIESIDKETYTRQPAIDPPIGGRDKKLYGITAVESSCRDLSNICKYNNGDCPSTHLCLLDGKGSNTCICGKAASGQPLCNNR